jgi:protein TonB
VPESLPQGLLERHPFLRAAAGLSLTEIEILHGVLRDPAQASGSFFYLRDGRFAFDLPPGRQERFRESAPERRKALSDLKRRLRASGRPVREDYHCAWDEEAGRVGRLAAFARQVLEDLWGAIAAHLVAQASKPALAAPIASSKPAAPAAPVAPAPAAPAAPAAAARVAPAEPATAVPSPLPACDENVQFTVYRPQAVRPETWFALIAFAHLAELPEDAPPEATDPVAEVHRQARQVLGEAFDGYRSSTQDSRLGVPHEAEVTFAVDVEGFEVNPPRRTFLWLEAVHREEFRLRAVAALDGETARGSLTVFLGSILLAEVSLAIRVDAGLAADRPSPPSEAAHARPYRRIFASYSHRDRSVVEQVERYARMLGDRYLRDWTELRSGEAWSERLKAMIEEADVFQLFWSWNALASPFVEQEWRHALSLGRPHFVRPTYWQVPLPESPELNLPPPELAALHFQLLAAEPAAAGTADVSADGAPLREDPRRWFASLEGPRGAEPSRPVDPEATLPGIEPLDLEEVDWGTAVADAPAACDGAPSREDAAGRAARPGASPVPVDDTAARAERPSSPAVPLDATAGRVARTTPATESLGDTGSRTAAVAPPQPAAPTPRRSRPLLRLAVALLVAVGAAALLWAANQARLARLDRDRREPGTEATSGRAPAATAGPGFESAPSSPGEPGSAPLPDSETEAFPEPGAESEGGVPGDLEPGPSPDSEIEGAGEDPASSRPSTGGRRPAAPPPPQGALEPREGGGTGAVPAPPASPPAVQVVLPRLEQAATPRYPETARRIGREADVEVRVLVDEEGRVAAVELVGPAPGLGFGEAALDAARRSRYRPGTRDGLPAAMWTTLTVSFRR